jgi:hypothetical protein
MTKRLRHSTPRIVQRRRWIVAASMVDSRGEASG